MALSLLRAESPPGREGISGRAGASDSCARIRTCSRANVTRGGRGLDKVFGVVVRAPCEGEARTLAQGQAGSEGLGIYVPLGCSGEEIADDVWLDPSLTACEPLDSDGPAGVILVDRRAA